MSKRPTAVFVLLIFILIAKCIFDEGGVLQLFYISCQSDYYLSMSLFEGYSLDVDFDYVEVDLSRSIGINVWSKESGPIMNVFRQN